MTSAIKFDLNSASTKQFQSLVQARLEQLKWSEDGDELLSEYCVVLLANNKSSNQITSELSEIVGNELFNNHSFVDWLVQKGEAFKEGRLDIQEELTSLKPDPISQDDAEFSIQQQEQQPEQQDRSSSSRNKPSRSNRLQDQAFKQIGRDNQRIHRDQRRQPNTSQRRSRSPESRDLIPTTSSSSSSSSFKFNRDRSRSPHRISSTTDGRTNSSKASFSLKGVASRGEDRDLFSKAIETNLTNGNVLAMDDPGLSKTEIGSNFDQERDMNPSTSSNGSRDPPTGPRELLPPSGPAAMRNSKGRFGVFQIGKDALRNTMNSNFNRNGFLNANGKGSNFGFGSIQNSNPSSFIPTSNTNLFGRMGVPNPKAQAFVSNSNSGNGMGFGNTSSSDSLNNGNGNESLLERMNSSFSNPQQEGNNLQPNSFLQNTNPISNPISNPNPNPFISNSIPSFQPSQDFSMQIDSSSTSTNPKEIPTKPTQSSLCRYGLICTSSTCQYAHPSPAATSNIKRGNLSLGPDNNGSVLVLTEEPCRFQFKCGNKDCKFSHVSPAVSFLMEKNESNGIGIGNGNGNGIANAENTPCKFKEACTNSQCPYAHFDSETGEKGPSPALKAALSGISQPSDPMDRALGDGKSETTICRFGTGCTRPNCYFSHPEGRSLNGNASKSSQGNNKSIRFNEPTSSSQDVSMNGNDNNDEKDSTHISDRLSKFNQDDQDNLERILPGQKPQVQSFIPSSDDQNNNHSSSSRVPTSDDRITDGDEVTLE